MDDRKMSYDSVALHDSDFISGTAAAADGRGAHRPTPPTPAFLSPVKDDAGNFPDVTRLDVEDGVYHVGGHRHHHPDAEGSEEGKRSTCRNPVSAVLNWIMPVGGATSNVVTLTAVALGSGVMALPLSFQQTGIVLGIIINTLITLSTVYSVYALMRAVEKTNRRFHSYETFARALLGPGWDYLAAFNMFVFGWCSCVFFVISIGSLLLTATDDDSVHGFLRTDNGNRILTLIVWVAVMLPVSIPKQINSLRYASLLACIAMIYFAVVMVVHFAQNGLTADHKLKHQSEIKMFRSGNPPMVGFSMVIFSYLCQINTFELYAEMPDPSPALLSRDTATGMTITLFIYFVVGIFGYLDFGNDIPSYILLTYNIRSGPMIAIAYAGMGLAMCFIYALVFQPARDALYYCLGLHFPMFRSVATVPFWLHCCICVPLSAVAMVAGLFIDKDNVWFSLIGSFCTAFLGFIFPALYWMYSGNWGWRTVGWFHYVANYLLLICGVASGVFGCAAVLYLEIIGS